MLKLKHCEFFIKTYIGVKIIKAEPCQYFDFLEKYRDKAYRDTIQPKSEDQEGYLVKYPPDGYISWSPKKIFEDAYFAMEKAIAEKVREQFRHSILGMNTH